MATQYTSPAEWGETTTMTLAQWRAEIPAKPADAVGTMWWQWYVEECKDTPEEYQISWREYRAELLEVLKHTEFADYTNVIVKRRGRDLPRVGDDVLRMSNDGKHTIMQIERMSRIQGTPGSTPYVWVTLGGPSVEYVDLSPERQREVYDTLYHATRA
jgi:hypothetical protein